MLLSVRYLPGLRLLRLYPADGCADELRQLRHHHQRQHADLAVQVRGVQRQDENVLGRYLMLSAVNNGSLTFFMDYLFDLRSGQKLFETSMGLLYEDKQHIVLMPSGVSLSWFAYNPEIGIFSKGGHGLKMYSYEMKPRPSCGVDKYDVTSTRGEHFIGSAKGFSFIRADNCGRFVVSKPWPKP